MVTPVSPAAKRRYCEERFWPDWKDTFVRHKVLVLPGIMGSQLFDYHGNDTVWIDFGLSADIARLGYSRLTPEGGVDSGGQMLIADRSVWPPVGGRPYGKFEQKVPHLLYPFDWRESMPVAAAWLRKFLRETFADRPASEHGKYSIVTHSMGGCLLLTLLSRTREFDDWFGQIICVAPPFGGALRPIRVIEYGNGTPADLLIGNGKLRDIAATMPGLFQLAPAPRDRWVTRLPVPGGEDIHLRYPIHDDECDVHAPSFWSESSHPMRAAILNYARNYYDTVGVKLGEIAQRLSGRFNVIVGLNGRNTLSRVTRAGDGWRFHKNGSPASGKYANGDATVLFQSSFLPDADPKSYWAYIPRRRRDIHSGMLDFDEVGDGIKQLLAGKPVTGLAPYNEFITKIDFGNERGAAPSPAAFADLDFEERARLREIVDYRSWDDHGLRGDNGDDHDLFHATHAAAKRVLEAGADIRVEAERLGQLPEFLEAYILKVVLPV